MIKLKELSDPNSCLNKAKDNELVFVLLERDKAAPAVVRMWCHQRLELDKNKFEDEQIQEALKWSQTIDNREIHDEEELATYVSIWTHS